MRIIELNIVIAGLMQVFSLSAIESGHWFRKPMGEVFGDKHIVYGKSFWGLSISIYTLHGVVISNLRYGSVQRTSWLAVMRRQHSNWTPLRRTQRFIPIVGNYVPW